MKIQSFFKNIHKATVTKNSTTKNIFKSIIFRKFKIFFITDTVLKS